MKKLLILMVTILITLTYCRKKIFDKRNKLVGTYEIHVEEEGYNGIKGYFDTIYVITGEIKKPTRKDQLPCYSGYTSSSFCEKENQQIILSTQQFTYYISYDPVENTLDEIWGKVYLNGFRYTDYYSAPGGKWQRTLVGIKK